MVGQAKANAIFSGAIHLLSAGTSDFLQNYYINPLLRVYSPDQFSDILIRSYSTFIQVTLRICILHTNSVIYAVSDSVTEPKELLYRHIVLW